MNLNGVLYIAVVLLLMYSSALTQSSRSEPMTMFSVLEGQRANDLDLVGQALESGGSNFR